MRKRGAGRESRCKSGTGGAFLGQTLFEASKGDNDEMPKLSVRR